MKRVCEKCTPSHDGRSAPGRGLGRAAWAGSGLGRVAERLPRPGTRSFPLAPHPPHHPQCVPPLPRPEAPTVSMILHLWYLVCGTNQPTQHRGDVCRGVPVARAFEVQLSRLTRIKLTNRGTRQVKQRVWHFDRPGQVLLHDTRKDGMGAENSFFPREGCRSGH